MNITETSPFFTNFTCVKEKISIPNSIKDDREEVPLYVHNVAENKFYVFNPLSEHTSFIFDENGNFLNFCVLMYDIETYMDEAWNNLFNEIPSFLKDLTMDYNELLYAFIHPLKKDETIYTEDFLTELETLVKNHM